MTRIARIAGLRIAGSATADAAACGGAVLEGDELYARLLGKGWRTELSARGWDAERAARERPTRRAWMYRPGAPEHAHERATETLALDAARRALADAGWGAGERAL